MIVSVKLSLLALIVEVEDDANELGLTTKGSRGSFLVGDSTNDPATLLWSDVD